MSRSPKFPPPKFTVQAAELQAVTPEPKARPVQTGEYIELATGGKFYYDSPEWDLGAIAHSLSMICRFTGHCRKFYSVAEHSVLVSRIMQHLDLGDPMEGLLHDGTESVLADIARPAKNLLPDYKAMETTLDASLRKNFALPEAVTEGCKTADWLALCLEARELLPTQGRDWFMPEGIRVQAGKLTFMPTGWTSDDARSRFMMRVAELRTLARRRA